MSGMLISDVESRCLVHAYEYKLQHVLQLHACVYILLCVYIHISVCRGGLSTLTVAV